MITPAFTGQYYQDTSTKKIWKANSTTPGDWTAVGNVNKSGAGDPTGVATPDFTGQTYRDTATGNIWTSTGLTNADWSLTVQDFGARWTPASVDISPQSEMTCYNNSITDFVFNRSSAYIFDIESTSLQTISAPNLTTVNDQFTLYGLPLLTSASFPALTTINDYILIQNVAALNWVFPALVTTNGLAILSPGTYSLPEWVSDPSLGGQIFANAGITSISMPKYLPTNSVTWDSAGSALNLTSVNHILDRHVANAAYVSGTINISGGTNAAPTQGPGSSHDILVARGVTVTHN